jgi:aryl-alcohol dehydrogenase-like predicted oxidoreductase
MLNSYHPARMPDPTRTAIGTWSGGRFMHFGEALGDERLIALLRPDERLRTVITADAYGAGEADALLGRAVAGLARESYCLVGALGHDFYEGEREGAKGFPRFTDPRLRDEDGYAGYLRMAAERSLERIGVDAFDLLLLHNPDRIGYTSGAVWDAMAALRDAGLTRLLGIAPGPANGFTLDLLDCFERFGALLDWAMVIFGPLEPWPGELVLEAARHHDVKLITRVVDYGGLFHDDVLPGHEFPRSDHRGFRPAGWVERGRAKLEEMRPIAERHGLSLLQLACQWNLAHAPVRCVAPTLIQEAGPEAKPIAEKREELASLAPDVPLSPDEVAAIRAIGDNTGSMALKGAAPDYEGEPRPDRWELTPELGELAARWGIDPGRDLQPAAVAGGRG